MSTRYRVKFQQDGRTVYGIVDAWSPEAKGLPQGTVLVDDAVCPRTYRVVDRRLTDIPLTAESTGRYNARTGQWEGGDDYEQHVRTEYQKAQQLSDSLPPGVHVGALFSVGVADGAAYYVVTKVHKRTCNVEWRGFCPDRYTDHHFGWGGKFPIAEIERYVGRARKRKELFGKRSTTKRS